MANMYATAQAMLAAAANELGTSGFGVVTKKSLVDAGIDPSANLLGSAVHNDVAKMVSYLAQYWPDYVIVSLAEVAKAKANPAGKKTSWLLPVVIGGAALIGLLMLRKKNPARRRRRNRHNRARR